MRRAYAYTGLVVLTWAVSLPATKAILLAGREGARLSPLQVAFWTIALGWAALLLTLAARGRLMRLRDVAGRGWLVVLAMGFFGWSSYEIALNIAFVRLPLPDAIVINYLHPVFVVVFQGAAFGALVRRASGWEQVPDRRARPGVARMVLGLGLCLVGVAMIATEGRLLALGAVRSSTGALAGLFAAFAWGVYSNLGRFVAVRPGADRRGMGDVHTWGAMTFGLALMAAVLWTRGELEMPAGYVARAYFLEWGPWEMDAWALIGLVGVVVYGGGYTLWLYALEEGARAGGAHKIPVLTYLTPVLGVIIGCVMLRESFGSGFWQGAALIAAGNAVNVWPARERAPSAKTP